MGSKMTNKEILVQLALGTFDPLQLYIIIQDTTNPEIIVAAAHLFVKLDIDEHPLLTEYKLMLSQMHL